MRYVFVVLAILGILASSLALREHYRTYGDAPCDINEKWDCGIVNHSPYAVFYGIPVADIGITGYLLLAVLALKRFYRLLLAAALIALGFLVVPGSYRSQHSRSVVRLLRHFFGIDLTDQPSVSGNGDCAICSWNIASKLTLL